MEEKEKTKIPSRHFQEESRNVSVCGRASASLLPRLWQHRKEEERGEIMDDLVVVAIGLLTFAIGFLVRGEISHLKKPKQ